MELSLTRLAVYRPIVVRAQGALADLLRLLHRRATLQLRRDVDVNRGQRIASNLCFEIIVVLRRRAESLSHYVPARWQTNR